MTPNWNFRRFCLSPIFYALTHTHDQNGSRLGRARALKFLYVQHQVLGKLFKVHLSLRSQKTSSTNSCQGQVGLMCSCTLALTCMLSLEGDGTATPNECLISNRRSLIQTCHCRGSLAVEVQLHLFLWGSLEAFSLS